MDAASIARDLIAALEELREKDAEIYELKHKLMRYTPEVLRDGKKASEGHGRVIQLVPKFTN